MGRILSGIVRSTFLIGPDGRVEYIWDPAKAKGHATEVLAKVKEQG
jgi:peroxiredoxin Q/BCP